MNAGEWVVLVFVGLGALAAVLSCIGRLGRASARQNDGRAVDEVL